MMGLAYLAGLLVAGGCLLLVDRRWRLFFWHDARRATVVTVAGTAFFLAWDAAGIAAGVFLRGSSAAATGLLLAPELPIEEPVFLAFLSLCTMVAVTGSARILRALARRRRAPHSGSRS